MTANIIIFDWDDTLLITTLTDYSDKKNTDIFALDLPPIIKTKLCQIDQEVCKLLSIASKIGKVYILTNAELSWIMITSKIYMPNTAKIMSKLPVISAQDRYKDITTDIILWKYYSMYDIIKESTIPIDLLLSIGDSDAERLACTKIAGELAKDQINNIISNPKRISSLKTYHCPTPDQLLYQLSYICKFISRIVNVSTMMDMKIIR